MALALAAAAMIVVVDQLTKLVMLRRDNSIQVRAAGAKRGALVTAQSGVVALPVRVAAPLWIAVVAGAIASLVALPVTPSPAAAVGIGLGIGGAFSNLADRLGRGGVVDFIAIWRWPAFNVADAGLVAGLGLVAVAVL